MDSVSRRLLNMTRQRNNRIAWLLSSYIDSSARAVTARLIGEMTADGSIEEEPAYKMLLATLCGLDTEASPEDRLLYGKYWDRAVHRLDAADYRADAYYAEIEIPHRTAGGWELTWQEYAPYEAFVCRDISLDDDLAEIPHAGYFAEEFRFPAVKECGREWIAVKPNEIETMRRPIEEVSGHVATLGLGMGYFAYMASRKPDVERITVVERDRRAVELFERFILPQFPERRKIDIVVADAFYYVERTLPSGRYDYLFADLWHDAGDGAPMYMRLKRCERLAPGTRFLYWIESSLLSRLRWELFDSVMSCDISYEAALRLLSDDSLRRMAAARP